MSMRASCSLPIGTDQPARVQLGGLSPGDVCRDRCQATTGAGGFAAVAFFRVSASMDSFRTHTCQPYARGAIVTSLSIKIIYSSPSSGTDPCQTSSSHSP
jgi:hypothetical protein